MVRLEGQGTKISYRGRLESLVKKKV